MQIIKITNVERTSGSNKQGPWTNTTITGEKGLKASTFTPNELKPGDTIEAELVKDGQYLNIKSFKKMNGQSQSIPARKEEPPTKDDLIMQQVAVKVTADLLVGKVITLDNELSKRMTKFLDDHLPK